MVLCPPLEEKKKRKNRVGRRDYRGSKDFKLTNQQDQSKYSLKDRK